MATYEWESITLGQNPEIQKIVSAAAKASELVTTNIGLAKTGLKLAQVFLIGVINPKVILLNAIADEIDNFANDFKNTGFFILEVVPTGMEMIPRKEDGSPVELTITAEQVNTLWAAIKDGEDQQPRTDFRKWTRAKLGEFWRGEAQKAEYKVVQGKIKSDDDAEARVGNGAVCEMHPIFNLPMLTPSQVIAQIISAMDDKLDDRRPQFSSSAEVGAIVIIIGASDITQTYVQLQTAINSLISFFGGTTGLMTKGFQKTANLIGAPFKVLTDGPSEDDAQTFTVINVCQVNGTDETKEKFFTAQNSGLYNVSGGFEVNDFVVGPRVKFGARVMGYVSEIVDDDIEDTPYVPYRTQTLKIIGASKLDQIAWKSVAGGATIQQAHFFENENSFTNQNTGERQVTGKYNDFKYFAELTKEERLSARTKVKLEAGKALLQPVGGTEDVNIKVQDANAAKCVMGTIFEPKKKLAPPPNFKSAKLEDLIGDFGGFFAGIQTISNAIRSMAGDSSSALDEMIEFLDKLIKKLDELNELLQKILKIFTEGLPDAGVFVLQIPPVVGGNDAIKTALEEATNRPGDNLDFSIGYVMIGGGPSMKVLNTLLAGG